MKLYREKDLVHLSPYSEFAVNPDVYQIQVGRKSKVLDVDEYDEFPVYCEQISNYTANGYRYKDLLPWK